MDIAIDAAFDLQQLFKTFHGYTPVQIPALPKTTSLPELPTITSITPKTENIYGQPLYGQSDMLGFEVFCPITIEAAGIDYDFPYCVVGIRRTKTVVMTEMTEVGGSVKEIIGNRDYDITVKGFVIGQYEQFPDEKIKLLNDVFEYNQVVRLKSAYTDLFLHDNDSVLILDLEIPEKAKVIGVRDFAFKVVSDNIFTLYES